MQSQNQTPNCHTFGARSFLLQTFSTTKASLYEGKPVESIGPLRKRGNHSNGQSRRAPRSLSGRSSQHL